jgi:hypothetical protein
MKFENNKEPKTNSHVSRLNRYLPFSVSHDQIYEEYQSDENGLSLKTRAFEYMELALSSGARCIVLTGDAGHGKTHLCRKLIESFSGYSTKESRELLLSECDGEHSIAPERNSGNSINLRIHKDFSEIDPSAAAEFIEKYSDIPNEALIICANEGRLRAVVNSDSSGANCHRIRELFHSTFESGLASGDDVLHIVNLNFQSIAVEYQGKEKSLITRTFQEWVVDGRRWSGSCDSCSLSPSCPIKRNRELLGESDLSTDRVNRIDKLCATLERLGYVITIREMLMLISYLITGGLTCKDVKERVRKNSDKGWQNVYAFYNLLFSRPKELPEDRLFKGIPVLEYLEKLDPGKIASRKVDDRLLNDGGLFEEDQLDLIFKISIGKDKKIIDAANGIDDVIGVPQSKSDLDREAFSVRNVVSSLRRRAFFDEDGDNSDMLSRLGFRYGDDFLKMLENNLSIQEKVRIKNIVVAGLHGIQGLRLSSKETTLYLVDPAFGKAGADAAIIAKQVPTKDIQLLAQRSAWSVGDSGWAMSDSVDWSDRSIVIRIGESEKNFADLALNLMAFECLVRASSGFISEDFYENEIRRIRTYLGKLADDGLSSDGQIRLFIGGRIQSVSLDMGVIQVSGGY